MQTLEEVLEAARLLPKDEQKRLVAELRSSGPEAPSEEHRKAAMQKWLAMAGTGHSDVTNVSTNKNKYLAEIYATKP